MKKIILTTVLLLFSFVSFCQTSIKMTKLKQQSYNKYSRKWSGWPTNWSYFSTANKPIFRMTKLDDTGRDFKVELWVSEEYFDFYVSYKSYDSKNGWSVYAEEDGDEVSILGTTLSYLCEKGWPSNKVQIYLWSYSDNYAIVME